MKLLTQEIRKSIPGIMTTDGRPPEQRRIAVKFFDPTGSWSWYAVEGEPVIEDGKEIDFEFFGLVDGFEQEWGYFRLSVLEHAKDSIRGLQALPIERDMYFDNKTIADVLN